MAPNDGLRNGSRYGNRQTLAPAAHLMPASAAGPGQYFLQRRLRTEQRRRLGEDQLFGQNTPRPTTTAPRAIPEGILNCSSVRLCASGSGAAHSPESQLTRGCWVDPPIRAEKKLDLRAPASKHAPCAPMPACVAAGTAVPVARAAAGQRASVGSYVGLRRAAPVAASASRSARVNRGCAKRAAAVVRASAVPDVPFEEEGVRTGPSGCSRMRFSMRSA